MRILLTAFLITSTLFIFTGCLTKELPSYNTYSLQLNQNSDKQTPLNKSIYIVQPKALASLQSRNFLYSNDLEQNHYALSVFSDMPSKMIQQIVTNYLSSLQSYEYVTTTKLNQRTDYTLFSELVAFEHLIEKETSYGHLAIRVYLKDNTSSKIYSKEFSYKEEVKTANAKTAMTALNNVSNLFVKELGQFIEQTITQ